MPDATTWMAKEPEPGGSRVIDTTPKRELLLLQERRERIAAMCLQGLLANAGGNADETKMAPMAIKHADALLKVLGESK